MPGQWSAAHQIGNTNDNVKTGKYETELISCVAQTQQIFSKYNKINIRQLKLFNLNLQFKSRVFNT